MSPYAGIAGTWHDTMIPPTPDLTLQSRLVLYYETNTRRSHADFAMERRNNHIRDYICADVKFSLKSCAGKGE